MLGQTINSTHIQNLFLKNTLKAFFGRHQSLPLEIIQTILAFLFASPFKPKNCYILKQGTLLVELRQSPQDSIAHDFFLSPLNNEIVTGRCKVIIKQGDHLMVGNRQHLNEKMRISKIWNKPQTKTVMKILTYCPKFKQFILGRHHQAKMIDQRYLNREFLIPHYQKDIFNKYLKDVKQNDANFCSNQVLDSYMALITINYIEIQVEGSEFNDRSEKKYKIVPEGANSQIFNGIKFAYDGQSRQWNLIGDDLVIWKQEKVVSRKKTLVRTNEGKLELMEGNTRKSVESFQFHFPNPE